MKRNASWQSKMLWPCIPLAVGLFQNASLGAPQTNTIQHPRFVEGELLVKLRQGPALQSALSPHARVGAQVVRTYHHLGWQHVRLTNGLSVAQGLARYQQMPEVQSVQPNFIRRVQATPNDPLVGDQWPLAKISATNAWNLTTGSSNVVVAVIDEGIDYRHEDLKLNMWRNPGEIPDNRI